MFHFDNIVELHISDVSWYCCNLTEMLLFRSD